MASNYGLLIPMSAIDHAKELALQIEQKGLIPDDDTVGKMVVIKVKPGCWDAYPYGVFIPTISPEQSIALSKWIDMLCVGPHGDSLRNFALVTIAPDGWTVQPCKLFLNSTEGEYDA